MSCWVWGEGLCDLGTTNAEAARASAGGCSGAGDVGTMGVENGRAPCWRAVSAANAAALSALLRALASSRAAAFAASRSRARCALASSLARACSKAQKTYFRQ
eukprot:1158186-Pelagomonas_calceolata.AAC.8